MRLYVIRHGESENNIKKCYTGWQDVSLTQNGIEDAKTAARYLSDVKFDKIYSSDLTRACKTAESALPGCEYETTSLLREVDVGNLAGIQIEKCKEIFGTEFSENMKNKDYSPYGGETKEATGKRVADFLDMAANSGYNCIAAFSHAGILKRMADYVLKASIPSKLMPCRNCAIAIFEHNGSEWLLHSWINIK